MAASNAPYVSETEELKQRVDFLEKQVMELLRGSDYGCGPITMGKRIRAQAKKDDNRYYEGMRKKLLREQEQARDPSIGKTGTYDPKTNTYKKWDGLGIRPSPYDTSVKRTK